MVSSITSRIKAVATIILSAIGSNNSPSFDSSLNILASKPSKKSVNDAITNNATLAKNYEATADERLREARFIDATENSLGTVESSEFTDARL